MEKKRILVADDSETITTLLTTALESGGYLVTTATDGYETYELGKTGVFDLVILDQLMPGLLGLEVIDRWQAEGVTTPVIVLSGVDDDRTVVDSFDRGAVDFVRKPFRVPELLARVRHRLSV
ncbi:MAG: response regulator [Actinobacteria bacterium]|nr:response regulator [Actinomycetota bacterium]